MRERRGIPLIRSTFETIGQPQGGPSLDGVQLPTSTPSEDELTGLKQELRQIDKLVASQRHCTDGRDDEANSTMMSDEPPSVVSDCEPESRTRNLEDTSWDLGSQLAGLTGDYGIIHQRLKKLEERYVNIKNYHRPIHSDESESITGRVKATQEGSVAKSVEDLRRENENLRRMLSSTREKIK
ncbi:hypothetical protein FOZ61_005823 [Perkinsus olseni]|uniref:Uncharacterized protein n=1 Tax=Perkinsus olseni TaxID=32597 RepID=A0A7J6LFV9_PEROL|nr:hypothetical protein FOZ61_005823 [Perkinsus olseni]